MLPDILDRSSIGEFKKRLEQIDEDTPRLWGTLDARGVMRHLSFVFDVSLGRENEKDISVPVVRNIVWFLFFNWFTNWPKGKLKAPAAFTPEPDATFEEEKARVLKVMDDFIAELEREPDALALSPLLGNIDMRKWSRVHGIHLRHHLKQFGAA